jgi:hypothetical protein
MAIMQLVLFPHLPADSRAARDVFTSSSGVPAPRGLGCGR